jgi:periplasmic protein TonB
MNAFALYIEERRGFSRWMLAALIILAVHAAIVASIALWSNGSRRRRMFCLPSL